jgi:NodT family efflux transporter outer membrane factor (OMF) lipoprotein
LQAQAENQRFELEATYLTLTSNVVAAAIQEASLRGQAAATQETIDIARKLLGVMQRQFALGQIARVDLLAQEAALAQAEQGLSPLAKQLDQQRDLLAALMGRSPGEEPFARFDLAGFTLPRKLPVSVPSRLVEQRPDVQAAAESLHAASAQIGVAVANRLPQFLLTADFGEAALKVASLFGPGSSFWTLGAQVTQPIFQGGTLLHKQRAAVAAFDQAKAQYRATVISALQNVADTLHALRHDAEAVQAADTAVEAAKGSLNFSRKQLELGATSYLTVLNAESTYEQARLNLVQAEANRLADTAALFQALGGGWWNRNRQPTEAVRATTTQVASDTNVGQTR